MRAQSIAPRRVAHRGFTLLELLLVLTLVVLAAGVVAPQLLRWSDGARERAGLAALRTALADLPGQAFFMTRPITVDAQGRLSGAREATLPLPTDWQLVLPQPLRYEPNGMTRGGVLDIIVPGRAPVRWEVVAPTGQIRDQDGRPPPA